MGSQQLIGMMEVATYLIITTTLFCGAACYDAVETHFFTVPSCHNHKDVIGTLPNTGLTEYKKSTISSDFGSNRIIVTQNGRIFSHSPLFDLAGSKLTIGVLTREPLSGKSSFQKIILQVVEDKQKIVDSRPLVTAGPLQRFKRATELSLSAEVRETVNEIILDYAGVGVIENDNNRYFLLDRDASQPFSSVDVLTGKLMIPENKRLDYETAPQHRYQLSILINNTASSKGERI